MASSSRLRFKIGPLIIDQELKGGTKDPSRRSNIIAGIVLATILALVFGMWLLGVTVF